MGRSSFTIRTCGECREPVSFKAKGKDSFPEWVKCPKCGKRVYITLNSGNNASTGDLISVNAGCGIGQEAQGNRDLRANNVDAHYDRQGTLHSANRQAQNEALATRGMANLDDGGFSTPKIRRIRERSLAGNPER